MAIDSVAIGANVWAREGEPCGRVTRFVLDPGSRKLAAIVIDHGPLLTERVVDAALVDRWGDGKVVLSLNDDAAGRLPSFTTRDIARGLLTPIPPERRIAFDPVAGFARYPDEDPAVPELSGGSRFAPVPPVTVVETISSVPPGTVVLVGHTPIESAAGFTAGHLHALELDEQQRVVGFAMTVGYLFKHHVRLPVSSIAGLTPDRIVLTQGLDALLDDIEEADVRSA
jgi:uncharacterized protein YrrD